MQWEARGDVTYNLDKNYDSAITGRRQLCSVTPCCYQLIGQFLVNFFQNQRLFRHIMTTYNNPLMTVAMTEMYASVMIIRHLIQNLMMMMKVGVIEKK